VFTFDPGQHVQIVDIDRASEIDYEPRIIQLRDSPILNPSNQVAAIALGSFFKCLAFAVALGPQDFDTDWPPVKFRKVAIEDMHAICVSTMWQQVVALCFTGRDHYLVVLSALSSSPNARPGVWLVSWSLATMSIVFLNRVPSDIPTPQRSTAFRREGMLHSICWLGDPAVLLRRHRDFDFNPDYKPLMYFTVKENSQHSGDLDEHVIGVCDDEPVLLTRGRSLCVVGCEKDVAKLEGGRVLFLSDIKGMAFSENIVTLVLDDGSFVVYCRK
jgi:hypothetical protein